MMAKFLQSRNFYLLILLIASFFFNAIITSFNYNLYIVNAGMAFTILLCLTMIAHSRIIAFIVIPLTVLTVAIYSGLYFFEPNAHYYTLHFTANAVFLLTVTIIQIRSIAMQEEVTLNTLLGAICGYLLIGLTWSYIYLAIAHLAPGSFNPMASNTTFRINLDYFTYFSMSTLTGLGYGDVVPVSTIARTFAWMETAIGQIYLAVWISQLVAVRIAQRLRKNLI